MLVEPYVRITNDLPANAGVHNVAAAKSVLLTNMMVLERSERIDGDGLQHADARL
jgi:hypothetical protein